MRSVRLTLKCARLILAALEEGGYPGYAEDLRIAMKPKRSLAPARKRAKAKVLSKRAKTRAVRDLVFERAGDFCECGCGRSFGGFDGVKTMDHFEGIARSETLETCWGLRWSCHQRKTAQSPNRHAWLNRFIEHCHKQGHHDTAAKAEREIDAEALLREAHAPGALISLDEELRIERAEVEP